MRCSEEADVCSCRDGSPVVFAVSASADVAVGEVSASGPRADSRTDAQLADRTDANGSACDTEKSSSSAPGDAPARSQARGPANA